MPIYLQSKSYTPNHFVFSSKNGHIGFDFGISGSSTTTKLGRTFSQKVDSDGGQLKLSLAGLRIARTDKNNKIQGFGVHSDEEITEFLVKAVELMATFVREEKRLADIERPCLVQATLFGFLLCTYRVKEVSTITLSEIGKYPELEAWTRNMAAKYYPGREFPA